MKTVIKVGGELMSDARRSELEAITADVAKLIDAGDQVLLIHGGGPQTTALQKQLGQTPNIVGGRRVTDDDTLAVVQMVVGGRMNITLTSALRAAGVNAVGLNGVSGGLITCVKRPPRLVSGGGDEPVDFGHVGDITGINYALISLLTGAGYTPVVACIGGGTDGHPFNINADVVANGIAVAVGADRLLLVTSTPGVLRDIDDPESRLATLSVAEGRAAIEDGTVQGGMIPKVEESLRSIEKGVGRIHIVGRLGAGDLIRAVEEPGAIGTTLLP